MIPSGLALLKEKEAVSLQDRTISVSCFVELLHGPSVGLVQQCTSPTEGPCKSSTCSGWLIQLLDFTFVIAKRQRTMASDSSNIEDGLVRENDDIIISESNNVSDEGYFIEEKPSDDDAVEDDDDESESEGASELEELIFNHEGNSLYYLIVLLNLD